MPPPRRVLESIPRCFPGLPGAAAKPAVHRPSVAWQAWWPAPHRRTAANLRASRTARSRARRFGAAVDRLARRWTCSGAHIGRSTHGKAGIGQLLARRQGFCDAEIGHQRRTLAADSRMFSGLMSRWTTPAACAYASAAATSRRRCAGRVHRQGASRARRARSVSPSTYGIVYQSWPAVSPESRDRECGDAAAGR